MLVVRQDRYWLRSDTRIWSVPDGRRLHDRLSSVSLRRSRCLHHDDCAANGNETDDTVQILFRVSALLPFSQDSAAAED